MGGFKVSALEIESVLAGHPSVAEVAVLALTDAIYGEVPAAVVATRPGAPPLSLRALRAFAARDLAPYKLPRKLKLVEAIPRNAMGKVNKRDLLGLFQK